MYNRRATFDGSLFQLILNYITLMLECNPILQTLLDISFWIYLFICSLKKTKLLSIFQNFVPQYIMLSGVRSGPHHNELYQQSSVSYMERGYV